jgi:hypothetical protein
MMNISKMLSSLVAHPASSVVAGDAAATAAPLDAVVNPAIHNPFQVHKGCDGGGGGGFFAGLEHAFDGIKDLPPNPAALDNFLRQVEDLFHHHS